MDGTGDAKFGRKTEGKALNYNLSNAANTKVSIKQVSLIGCPI